MNSFDSAGYFTIGYNKVGKTVYVYGYFDLLTTLDWNSFAILFSDMPIPCAAASVVGCILSCHNTSYGERSVVVDGGGSIVVSALNDMQAGRYAISGMYIANN